jgi:hypothetical protein
MQHDFGSACFSSALAIALGPAASMLLWLDVHFAGLLALCAEMLILLLLGFARVFFTVRCHNPVAVCHAGNFSRCTESGRGVCHGCKAYTPGLAGKAATSTGP